MRVDDEGGSPIPAQGSDVPHSPAYANYVLGVLVLLYIINYVDRQILSVLIEPIKRDLGVSDTAMGLLSGIAFALFYTSAGIPIARLADRGSRRNVISVGVVVWSAMTALSGLAQSFAQLALARVGVGCGEAALSPASHSLITDYFPPERRATALSIYNIGGNLGIMLGFIAGGFIGEAFGWRIAFLIVGLPGLAAALLARLTIREPLRGAMEARQAESVVPSAREVFRYMWGLRSFRHLSLSAAFYAFAAYGFVVWGATFLIRVHGMSLSESGLWMGLIQGVGGGVGTYVGGRLCDRLGAQDARWMVWIPALGGALSLPLLAVFLFWPGKLGALAGYAPAMMFSVFFVGPSYALTQSLAKLRMRAQASALVMFVMNLIGLGIAPLAVGALNDAMQSRFGAEAVRYSLMVTGTASLWAITHSLRAARTLREDLARAQAS